jgi:hypothetical protein
MNTLKDSFLWSWEADSCSETQEMSVILWNPKVHYSDHKSLLLDHIMRCLKRLHTVALRSILILSAQVLIHKFCISFYLVYVSYKFGLFHPPVIVHFNNIRWSTYHEPSHRVKFLPLSCIQIIPRDSSRARPFARVPNIVVFTKQRNKQLTRTSRKTAEQNQQLLRMST